jgi:HAD superfamily hydrolase (TIGR01549 family)
VVFLKKLFGVQGMLKGFFFDLDGTLIRAPEEDFYETISELGLNYPLEEVCSAYMAARVWYRESANSYRTGEELWIGFADQVLLRLGFKEQDEELIEKIREGMDRKEKGRLYPETLPVLELLKDKGFYLAIISSRPLEGVEQKLAKFGLSRFFSLVLGRESVREIKPSPLPFILALKQSGLGVKDVVFVGDSPQEDLAGAQSMGIRAYIVDRRGRLSPAPYVISSLRELLSREKIA